MLIAKEWLKEQGACYKNWEIDRLAAGREHITVTELLELPIPDWDKIWVLLRMLTEEQLKVFAQSCADAVDFDSVFSHAAKCFASEDVLYHASIASETARYDTPKEYLRQINWLKEALK